MNLPKQALPTVEGVAWEDEVVRLDRLYGKGNWHPAWRLTVSKKGSGTMQSLVTHQTASYYLKRSYAHYFHHDMDTFTKLMDHAGSVRGKHALEHLLSIMVVETLSRHFNVRQSPTKKHKIVLLSTAKRLNKKQLGSLISPGRVPFYAKQCLGKQISGWWDEDSVASFLVSNRWISFSNSVKILEQQAISLHIADSAEIIMRDVKQINVLLKQFSPKKKPLSHHEICNVLENSQVCLARKLETGDIVGIAMYVPTWTFSKAPSMVHDVVIDKDARLGLEQAMMKFIEWHALCHDIERLVFRKKIGQ